MKHYSYDFIGLLAALLLTGGLMNGCASSNANSDRLTEALADMSLQVGEPVDSIFQYRIDSWRHVDQQHLIIKTRPKKHYLVKFHTPCIELSAGSDIGFTTTSSSLTKFDKIVVKNFGEREASCTIRSIHQLNPKATEE